MNQRKKQKTNQHDLSCAEAEYLLGKITEYLNEHGLRIKEAKTRIVKATEGFDFLGWHFRVKAKKQLATTPGHGERNASEDNPLLYHVAGRKRDASGTPWAVASQSFAKLRNSGGGCQ